MKINIILFLIPFIQLGCSNLLQEGTDYWSKDLVGNNNILQQEYKIYLEGGDTIYSYVNYYENGLEKSKTRMVNDLLIDIFYVKNLNGEKVDFGTFRNGNGHVTQYRSDSFVPRYSGEYKNGNRVGWWKSYHFKGKVMDSTFYVDGYPQRDPAEDEIGRFLNALSLDVKENWYK